MTMIVHRNVAKKHFCPGCDHFHEVINTGLPTPNGVCLRGPPQAFVVGMGQAAIAPMDKPAPVTPIIRGYYPPVGPADTCAQWTPRHGPRARHEFTG